LRRGCRRYKPGIDGAEGGVVFTNRTYRRTTPNAACRSMKPL
jgi:hypothetical protein